MAQKDHQSQAAEVKPESGEEKSLNENQQEQQQKGKLSQAQLDVKKQYAYIIKRKSVRTKARRKTAALIMVIFVLIATLIAGLVYGVLSFIDFNSFRITIERTNLNYLALSDDYDFTSPTSVLSVDGPKSMDNWTYSWLNITNMLENEGSLSDNDYIACAFYLENRGENSVFYSENVTLTNVYKGLEDAIRILLIKQIETTDESGNKILSNPEYRCFAKVGADGVSNEYVAGGDDIIPEYTTNPNLVAGDADYGMPWECISFAGLDSGVVTDTTYYPLEAGQKIRYAMAVWIEGTDPECVDSRIGGKVSYTFQFSLLTDDENNVVLG